MASLESSSGSDNFLAASLENSSGTDSSAVEGPPSAKKNRKNYDKNFKLKIIAYAEKVSNREASRKFGVPESCIRDWKKNRAKIEQTSAISKRLPGGGRKACSPCMEEALADWIDSYRSCHFRVTRSAIQRKALELYDGDTEFTASRGWLERFLTRHGYSLRRRTTVSQSLPNQLVNKVSSFILHVRKLRQHHQYALSAIGNMDETPLWLDMPGDTTINRIGEQTISVRTTGHEKGRFTVILGAKADGTKLKPFVVFKGIREVPAVQKVPGVVVCMSSNGWMNESLTIKWIDSVWGRLTFHNRLLVWDAYR